MSSIRAFYSPLQRRFDPPPVRLRKARPQPHPDTPQRLDAALAALRTADVPVHAARRHDPFVHCKGVHSLRYVGFLRDAVRVWREAGNEGRPRPLMHPVRRPARRPLDIVGVAGWHMADGITPLTTAVWPAACASADAALSAVAAVLADDGTAYALCRPPGRHAGFETMAGFCYLNNAALAANALRKRHARVALISIGLHHAHGTQEIFWRTDRVYTISIHVDPRYVHPYYWGYEPEAGEGRGYGFNLNLPLPPGSDDDVWCGAVEYACRRISRYRPGALVVAVGFGMMRGDCPWEGPDIAAVGLSGVARMATLLRALALPTVIVQEGGWNLKDLELGLAAFLTAWREGR